MRGDIAWGWKLIFVGAEAEVNHRYRFQFIFPEFTEQRIGSKNGSNGTKRGA
jgi:hypothetical protein